MALIPNMMPLYIMVWLCHKYLKL